jgi:Acetyltransferase (GNAT) domain
MPLRIEPTDPTQQAAVIEFLASVFHTNSKASFLEPRLIHWKYFEPCADWTVPRSLLAWQDGKIVAHTGIVPITFRVPGRDVRVIHLIDWAADPAAPGAGVLILRKAQSLAQADAILAVGGSHDTREIMPRLDFKEMGELRVFARVVRPWAQLRTGSFRGFKAPVRFLRNFLWSMAPLPSVPERWSAEPVDQFDDCTSGVFATQPVGPFTCCGRTAAVLNYMLRCPGAKFAAYLLHENKQLRGYFLLSQVGRQYRIADMQLASAVPADWQAAWALATRATAENAETCEVAAAASVPLSTDIISESGYHLRDSQPIFISDPKKLLAGAPPLKIDLLDGEGAYLFDPKSPYLT